ncbi:MAG TPA: hypothetical protein VN300_09660, partial [Desulfobacterales bacterium]|nr:hypothetical protein [Desulfobacterales bacterium]
MALLLLVQAMMDVGGGSCPPPKLKHAGVPRSIEAVLGPQGTEIGSFFSQPLCTKQILGHHRFCCELLE